jgi:hypothetical protein
MKVISIDKNLVLIEFRGKRKELEIYWLSDDRTQFSIAIAGRVGYTGRKLWIGRQFFFLEDGQWKRGSAHGGLNGRTFTPICFVEDIPENTKSKR